MNFSLQTYKRRRDQLKQDVGQGILLFLGNGEVGINYADNTYPFRQDSSFLYFFGISQPGLAAIIDIDEGREVVFGNELTIERSTALGCGNCCKWNRRHRTDKPRCPS